MRVASKLGSASAARGGLALLLIDMQMNFLLGALSRNTKELWELIRNQKTLLQFAKREQIPVYRVEYRNRGATLKPLTQDLPRGNTTTVIKNSLSAFAGTTLRENLRARSVTQIVCVGIESDKCVAATVFDALAYRFEVALPDNCHGILYEKSGLALCNRKSFLRATGREGDEPQNPIFDVSVQACIERLSKRLEISAQVAAPLAQAAPLLALS